MKIKIKIFNFILIFFALAAAPVFAGGTSSSPEADGIDLNHGLLYVQETGKRGALPEQAEEEDDLDYHEEEIYDEIADPLEPVNRVFFYFNDRLYFRVLKPVASGYAAIVPEGVRISLRNFFNNITSPVRFVNSILQFKARAAGNELARFAINSTAGILGLFDVAKDEFGMKMQDEDLGQTLGVWGAGPGFYICWPVIGPSSLRDSIGYAGDLLLDPVSYVTPVHDRYSIGIGDRVNRTSLRLGEYEEIKKDAIDPYAAFRDIYYQYRKSRIDR